MTTNDEETICKFKQIYIGSAHILRFSGLPRTIQFFLWLTARQTTWMSLDCVPRQNLLELVFEFASAACFLSWISGGCKGRYWGGGWRTRLRRGRLGWWNRGWSRHRTPGRCSLDYIISSPGCSCRRVLHSYVFAGGPVRHYYYCCCCRFAGAPSIS